MSVYVSVCFKRKHISIGLKLSNPKFIGTWHCRMSLHLTSPLNLLSIVTVMMIMMNTLWAMVVQYTVYVDKQNITVSCILMVFRLCDKEAIIYHVNPECIIHSMYSGHIPRVDGSATRIMDSKVDNDSLPASTSFNRLDCLLDVDTHEENNI